MIWCIQALDNYFINQILTIQLGYNWLIHIFYIDYIMNNKQIETRWGVCKGNKYTDQISIILMLTSLLHYNWLLLLLLFPYNTSLIMVPYTPPVHLFAPTRLWVSNKVVWIEIHRSRIKRILGPWPKCIQYFSSSFSFFFYPFFIPHHFSVSIAVCANNQ